MNSSGDSNFSENLLAACGDAEAFEEICRKIAADVEAGRTKIHALVEDLGPHLTNIDAGLRLGALKTLSQVLKLLDPESLSGAELLPLASFYCEKLGDHHAAGPAAIGGILAMVRMENLPEEAPAQFLRRIFERVRCASESRTTRCEIYEILRICVDRAAEKLRSIEHLVSDVIAAIDGESDPRNLILLFDFLPKFMEFFPPGNLAEDMFEVLSCYFPVDLNYDPPSHKEKITREELANKLAPCLCASPDFAEFCVPLILEKLESPRAAARRDSLQLLAKGAGKFGLFGLREHLPAIWEAIKHEATKNIADETQKLALEAISEIIAAIGGDERVLVDFVRIIVEDSLRQNAREGNSNSPQAPMTLFATIARAGKKSFVELLVAVVPPLIGEYNARIRDQDAWIENFNCLLEIARDYGFSIGEVPELKWTEIPRIYLEMVEKEEKNRDKLLSGLALQKKCLTERQRESTYEIACRSIDAPSANEEEAGNIARSVFREFALSWPEEVSKILENRLEIRAEMEFSKIAAKRLCAHAQLADLPFFGPEVLGKLMKIANSTSAPMALRSLREIRKILLEKNSEFDVGNFLFVESRLPERIFGEENSEKLDLLGQIFRAYFREIDREKQEIIFLKYSPEIFQREKIAERDVAIFEAFFVPLRPEIRNFDANFVVKSIFTFVLDSTITEAWKNRAGKLSAVLITKTMDRNDFSLATNLRGNLLEILEFSNSSSLEAKKSAFTLHTWLTKALLCLGHPESQKAIEFQIDAMRREGIADHATRQFQALHKTSEDDVTKENFCKISLFWVQRILENLLLRGDLFDAEDAKKNYLTALTRLIDDLPAHVPLHYLKKLLPALVESLALLDEPELTLSNLRMMKKLLETKNEICLEYFESLVGECLRLGVDGKTMNVRIAALECVLSFCDYPVVDIVKHKTWVVDKLAIALDDAKRKVRSAAVAARTRWCLIGAPGGPE